MYGEHAGTTARQTVPRNRRRVGTGVAAMVLILGSAACTGDPAPVTTPSGASTTATAPTTPEPTRPVEAATPESAIQFTRYFWDLYNYAYQTYDTAPLKAISQESCNFCASAISDISKSVDTGAKSSGSTVSVIEATSPPVKITSGTLVVMTVSQQPGRLVLPSGKVTEDAGWKQLRTDFSLAWRDKGWSVEGVNARTKTGIRWGS